MMKLCFLLSFAAAYPTWPKYKEAFELVLNEEEDARREAIYNENVAFVDAQNARNLGYVLGVNKLSMYTDDEFMQFFLGEEEDDHDAPSLSTAESDVHVVDSIDWSTRSDIVNPVKNQGRCGSCWAFGAVGVLETNYAIATGTLHRISEQQLVDCDHTNHGCQGGLSRKAFKYYKRSAPCSEESYPYQAVNGTCDRSCTAVIPPGFIKGYSEVPSSVDALQAALMQRPIKVSVHGDSAWKSYESGIMTGGECYSGTNHAVLVVGFEAGSFWKIRNSWGEKWGEHGYVRMGQQSSCKLGPWAIWGRTPIYPRFSSLAIGV